MTQPTSRAARANRVTAALASLDSVPERQRDMLARAQAIALQKGRSERLAIALAQAMSVLIVLGVWQFASGRVIDAEAVSSPVDVFSSLWVLFSSGRIWPDVWQTVFEVVAGFSIGAVIGLLLALAFALVPSAQAVLRPFLIAFYAVPKIALAPLLIMWLGLETSPKIALAATFVFFVVFMNAVAGVDSVNPHHVMLARIMGAKRMTVLQKITLPSILPFMLVGFRLAIPEAVIGAVIGEFIASDKGLGHLVSSASSQFNVAVSLAAIFVLLAIVAIADLMLSLLERNIPLFKGK